MQNRLRQAHLRPIPKPDKESFKGSLMEHTDCFTRLFYPDYAARQKAWLDEQWTERLKKAGWSRGRGEELLPDLTPLLTSSIQPADFVKQYAKQSMRASEEMKQPRQDFDLAVAKESIVLEAKSHLADKQHHAHILALAISSGIILMLLLILSTGSLEFLRDSSYVLLASSMISLLTSLSIFIFHHFRQELILVESTIVVLILLSIFISFTVPDETLFLYPLVQYINLFIDNVNYGVLVSIVVMIFLLHKVGSLIYASFHKYHHVFVVIGGMQRSSSRSPGAPRSKPGFGWFVQKLRSSDSQRSILSAIHHQFVYL